MKPQFKTLFDWPVTSGKVALMDLRFLALASTFWQWGCRYEEGIEFLINVYGVYAEWLFYQRRTHEAAQVCRRVLALRKLAPNAMFAERAVIRLAESQAGEGSPAGLGQGIRTLRHWLPVIQTSQHHCARLFHAWMLSTLAVMESRRGNSAALALANRAVEVAKTDHNYLDNLPYREMDRAQTLLHLGRFHEALEAADSLNAVSPTECLLRAETHLALCAGATAQEWLQRANIRIEANSEVEAHTLPYFRARADQITDRLALH